MFNKDQIILENQYTKILEGQFGIGGQPVTKAQLIQLIKAAETAHKGTNFFSVTQVTKETTNKAPLPTFVLSGLKNGKTQFAKISQVNIQVGYDYSAAVNRQREKEGKQADFTAKASPFTPVPGSNVLVSKDNQLYIRYRPMQTSSEFKPVIVKANKDNPMTPADFTVTSKAEVNQYRGAVASTGAYQGVASGVEVRTISIDSVVAARIGGREYVVTDLDPVRDAIYRAGNGPQPEEGQVP